MSDFRVLYVAHNHPTLHPGGAEAYSLELYEAMRRQPGVEPVLLARIGSNVARRRVAHPGTLFSTVNDDPNQYFVFTETDDFDFFTLTSRDKSLYSRHLPTSSLAQRPDVVHLQHTLFIGYDMLSQIAARLPDAAIVYTLHEFLPICHRHGQMVRTFDRRALLGSLAAALPRVLPRDQPAVVLPAGALRQGALRQRRPLHRPQPLLMDKYVDWGIGAERISRGVRPAAAGRAPATRDAGEVAEPPRLLRPAQPLQGRRRADGGDGAARPASVDAHLLAPRRQPRAAAAGVPGASSRALLEAAARRVTFGGRYDHRSCRT